MKAVYDTRQSRHNPRFFLVKGSLRASTEQPERADRLLTGLERCGLAVTPSADFGAAPRHAIHTERYLQFLENASRQWHALGDASAEVIANIHPSQPHASYPESIIGRAGWHMADTACPLGKNTFDAACHSANTALTATQMVLDGERMAYALCRPPGHHAYADMAGGFCFLNNIAIAAQHARNNQRRKVAILDVDVHHGNGTQGIFYERNDVFTASVHTHPANFYPFYWGYAEETGAKEGDGYNLNIPLVPLSGDDVFLSSLDQALAAIDRYDPDVLLIALGLDASEADPLRGLSVTTGGFEKTGRKIAAFGKPTVFVQEGGYLSPILSDNLTAVLNGAMHSA